MKSPEFGKAEATPAESNVVVLPGCPEPTLEVPPFQPPRPCPHCGFVPSAIMKREILGSVLECRSHQVACTNRACEVQPKSKVFGWADLSDEGAKKLERMALFDWNTRIAPVPEPDHVH